MAQEFAGLPDTNNTIGARAVGRSMDTVNMYLAAYVTFILSCTRNADLWQSRKNHAGERRFC